MKRRRRKKRMMRRRSFRRRRSRRRRKRRCTQVIREKRRQVSHSFWNTLISLDKGFESLFLIPIGKENVSLTLSSRQLGSSAASSRSLAVCLPVVSLSLSRFSGQLLIAILIFVLFVNNTRASRWS